MTSKNSKKSSFQKNMTGQRVWSWSPIYLCGGGGLLTMLCLTLATPWTAACQAPLSMRFSRQKCWSGLPFPSPGDFPNPGIEPRSPALQADSLPTGEAPIYLYCFPRSLYHNTDHSVQVPHPSEPGRATFKQDLQKLLWAVAKFLCGETDTEL